MTLYAGHLARYLEAMNQLVRACHGRGDATRLRPATPHELRALRELGIRDPVLSLLAAAAPDSTCDLLIRFHDPAGIVHENTKLGPGENICPLGFPVIASTHSGDAFALDYNSPPAPDGTPRVLLVSHEQDAAAILAHALAVAESYIEFIEGAAADRYDY